jgi:hypothetical protein
VVEGLDESVLLLLSGRTFYAILLYAMLGLRGRGWSSVCSSCHGLGLLVCLYLVMLPCLCQYLL